MIEFRDDIETCHTIAHVINDLGIERIIDILASLVIQEKEDLIKLNEQRIVISLLESVIESLQSASFEYYASWK